MNITIPLPTLRSHRIAVSALFFLAGITFASWASRIPHIKEQLHLAMVHLDQYYLPSL
jgi:hypothetical protein